MVREGWLHPPGCGCQGLVPGIPAWGFNGGPPRRNRRYLRTSKDAFLLGGQAIAKIWRQFDDACRQFGDLNF